MASAIDGIDHVGVVVSDMDQSIDFYSKHLGFLLLARYTPENGYHRETAYLKFPGRSEAKLELYSLVSPPPGEVTYERKIGMREIALKVTDVGEVVERLRTSGVEVLAEPTFSEASGLPDGSPVKRRTRAAVKAPDGVIIGLYNWG